jgi:hypothetical protein
MVMTILVSPSCKSVEPVTADTHHSSLVAHQSTDTHHSSLIAYNSLHDSVIYRERTIHDTVYITKEVYRDAHHSSLIAHNSTKADTVVVTEWREKVIEHPPERYVPKFYKWCTVALWVIVLLVIERWAVRRWCRV